MSSRQRERAEILRIAREKLDFQSLRPGQEEAIRSILDKNDTLVVQPTGSGKSAIYQIAGLMLEGTTVVVSPLIALQKDQVDSINDQNGAEAAVVNSTQRVAETRDAFERFEQGEIEYLFLSPEQLRKQETIERVLAAKPSLFVVDEAHCISEWGHDFRPDYMGLGAVIEALGHPVVLALTATAAQNVRSEIVERLGMRKPRVFVQGFDRPNISLRVDHFATEREKEEALVHRTRWASKPGIIYVATRRNAENIMRALAEAGVNAAFYHAGLKAKERDEIQRMFMNDEAEVIVATNAFGMGVDKADVRFVYHYDISDSLDSYYQEIGRSGRDGEPAEAVLFYRVENLGVRKFQAGTGKLESQKIERLGEVLRNEDAPVEPEQIGEQAGLSRRKVTTMLNRLEEVGAVERLASGEVQLTENTNLTEAAQAAADEQARRKEESDRRIQQMQAYAELTTCRRQFLLQYFGDDLDEPCGNCDNCEGNAKRIQGSSAVSSGVGTRREVTG